MVSIFIGVQVCNMWFCSVHSRVKEKEVHAECKIFLGEVEQSNDSSYSCLAELGGLGLDMCFSVLLSIGLRSDSIWKSQRTGFSSVMEPNT